MVKVDPYTDTQLAPDSVRMYTVKLYISHITNGGTYIIRVYKCHQNAPVDRNGVPDGSRIYPKSPDLVEELFPIFKQVVWTYDSG